MIEGKLLTGLKDGESVGANVGESVGANVGESVCVF
jgi:hypothetical protein